MFIKKHVSLECMKKKVTHKFITKNLITSSAIWNSINFDKKNIVKWKKYINGAYFSFLPGISFKTMQISYKFKV